MIRFLQVFIGFPLFCALCASLCFVFKYHNVGGVPISTVGSPLALARSQEGRREVSGWKEGTARVVWWTVEAAIVYWRLIGGYLELHKGRADVVSGRVPRGAWIRRFGRIQPRGNPKTKKPI